MSPQVGSNDSQPVMFDMDPFGGKQVYFFCSDHHRNEHSVRRFRNDGNFN